MSKSSATGSIGWRCNSSPRNGQPRHGAAVRPAEYKTAKTGCGSLSGKANDICVADAKVRMKTTDVIATADEKTSAARSDASEEVAVVRKDAHAEHFFTHAT